MSKDYNTMTLTKMLEKSFMDAGLGPVPWDDSMVGKGSISFAPIKTKKQANKQTNNK